MKGETVEAIFKRVSVRKFSQEHVEDEKVEKLLRAAMAAPSGGNQQPWQFIVVDDPALCEQLGQTSPYSKPAAAAPLNIVPVMDKSSARFPEIAEQDMSACIENMLLEAVEIGLGAVWQGVYPVPERMQHIRDIFGLDEGLEPFALVSIGYPEQEARAQQDRYDQARVHRNAW